MNQMSDKELCLYVLDKLIEQGGCSYQIIYLEATELPQFSCLYRNYNGEKIKKCAAGHLIPDENYGSEIESSPIDAINSKLDKNIHSSQYHLVKELQKIHDFIAVLDPVMHVPLFNKLKDYISSKENMDFDLIEKFKNMLPYNIKSIYR